MVIKSIKIGLHIAGIISSLVLFGVIVSLLFVDEQVSDIPDMLEWYNVTALLLLPILAISFLGYSLRRVLEHRSLNRIETIEFIKRYGVAGVLFGSMHVLLYATILTNDSTHGTNFLVGAVVGIFIVSIQQTLLRLRRSRK
jgi:hypothetical protein